jgi:hypothetical protein
VIGTEFMERFAFGRFAPFFFLLIIVIANISITRYTRTHTHTLPCCYCFVIVVVAAAAAAVVLHSVIGIMRILNVTIEGFKSYEHLAATAENAFHPHVNVIGLCIKPRTTIDA